MKQIKSILTICALFVGGFLSTIYSQNVWSLERCILYALDNNIQIKQQELNTRYQKNALTRSIIDVLPSINGDFGIGSSSGRALDQTTYQFSENQTIVSSNMSATTSLVVFNGFQKNQYHS
ncbi:MAG: hypothetical protein HC906_08490 [Bacteroidales bacterium]|nr:hypothetical protein [Bacteroidales bacterium]